MDVSSLLTLVVLALFLAVQPWSVLAAVLLVTAPGGLRKEYAFVAGWVAALSVVAALTVLVQPSVPHTTGTDRARAWVEIAVGVLLGGWLLWRWRRPQEAGSASQPSWMRRLDDMPLVFAFGLGAFLPTYAVVIVAVSEMIFSGLGQAWLIVVAAVWVVLASAGVAAPLIVLLRDREHASSTYERWRVWIIGRTRVIQFSIGALVCLILLVKGVAGLFG